MSSPSIACPFHDEGQPLSAPLNVHCSCCPICGAASDWVTVCGDVIQMACPEGHPDWSFPVQAEARRPMADHRYWPRCRRIEADTGGDVWYAVKVLRATVDHLTEWGEAQEAEQAVRSNPDSWEWLGMDR